MPKLIAGHTLVNYDENVSRVIIPNFVYSIADKAFSERGNIKAVEMGASITGIGNYAFRMCYGMREIVLPEEVEEFGVGVFENCWALESVALPSGVKRIDRDMFLECNTLRDIFIPDSVSEIDATAFDQTPLLERLVISPARLGILPASHRDLAVLTYMAEHSDDEPAEADGSVLISEYAQTHGDTIMRLAIGHSNAGAIRYMIRASLIRSEQIAELVDLAAGLKNSEIVAMLIDEQDKLRAVGAEPAEEEWNPFA